MHPIHTVFVTTFIAAIGLMGSFRAQAQDDAQGLDAESVPKVVADYSVFFDPPTGFVFVKLPAGWKFVGRGSAEDLARLPATVLTSLLESRRAVPEATARFQR